MSFAIITDTSANLPSPLLRKHGIAAVPFHYYIKGREFACTDTEAFDGKSYYDAIREGSKVSTSLVSPAEYADYFRVPLAQGEDLLFVGMSSGISGSFGSAQLAAEQLREEFPDRELHLVDSIGASLGEGFLALKAVELREVGKTAAETAQALDALRQHMCQVFTVDDLMHLRSTGRLSNAAAVIATVLNI